MFYLESVMFSDSHTHLARLLFSDIHTQLWAVVKVFCRIKLRMHYSGGISPMRLFEKVIIEKSNVFLIATHTFGKDNVYSHTLGRVMFS